MLKGQASGGKHGKDVNAGLNFYSLHPITDTLSKFYEGFFIPLCSNRSVKGRAD